jgi:hypothetical protein
MSDELPLNDERRSPRKGSAAWKLAEFQRFKALSRKHDGLTTPLFATIALGVSRQRVYQLIDSGHLPVVEVLGKMFILCDELDRFAALERRSYGFRYDGGIVS